MNGYNFTQRVRLALASHEVTSDRVSAEIQRLPGQLGPPNGVPDAVVDAWAAKVAAASARAGLAMVFSVLALLVAVTAFALVLVRHH